MATNTSAALDALPFLTATTATPWCSLATHPITIMLSLIFHCALVIGFTTPTSLLRLTTLPFQPAIASLVFDQRDRMRRWGTASHIFVAAFTLALPLQYVTLALLNRWSFEADGPSPLFRRKMPPYREKAAKTRKVNGEVEKKRPDTVLQRLKFGLNTTLSTRHLNTPYESRNSPHFDERDPSYVPPKGQFLLRTAAVTLACALLADFSFAANGLEGAKMPITHNQIPFFSRLPHMTVRELADEVLIRAVVIPTCWLVTAIVVQVAYGAQALIAVGLGIYEPKDYRPVIGRVSGGYTVRRFWGQSWHQLLRDIVIQPPWFLAEALGLPSHGPLRRFFEVVVAFTISGVLHGLIDGVRGISWDDSGALRFFLMQPLGIVLEELVQEVWRRLFGTGERQKDGWNTEPALWKRAAGFVWWGFFMGWTLPVWMYPNVLKQADAVPLERAFPWSLAERILGVGEWATAR